MTRRSSLMEWLDQTRKLAKSKDMISLDMVDGVLKILHLLDKKMIIRHEEFFDDICGRYHKANPIEILRNGDEVEDIFKEKHGGKSFKKWRKEHLVAKECLGRSKIDRCPLSDEIVKELNEFVESAILMVETAQKDILWQWFEVIDFMFERPELINPNLIDEYVTDRIFWVCKKHKKNNPLANGMRARFGKYWKDDKGRWHKERRVRL